jgi:ABC-2 type transport system permease protein
VGTGQVSLALAGRSLIRIYRVPATFIPSIVMPIFLVTTFSGLFGALTRLPGFPVDDMIDWMLPMAIVQGSAFAGTTSALGLAFDIENGFFDRLSLTPMRPAALLSGMLAGVVALGLIQGVVFLAFGLLMGVSISSGILGMLVIVALTVLVALGFGGLGAMLAIRTGSVEAVESAFPLFFVAIFMSSINLPRNLIEQDWFRLIATINPISYLVEGIRSLVITGWDGQALLLGFGWAAALVVLAIGGAAASMRTRVA